MYQTYNKIHINEEINTNNLVNYIFTIANKINDRDYVCKLRTENIDFIIKAIFSPSKIDTSLFIYKNYEL